MRKCTAEIYCKYTGTDIICCADCDYQDKCPDACSYRDRAGECELAEVSG